MIVDRFLHVGIDELTASEWRRLEKALTFVTDAGDVANYYRRLLTRGKYLLPRGAWFLLPDHIRYVDNRTCPEMPKLKFRLKLDDVEKDERFAGQRAAVDAMFENEQGLIIRPPGTGKTQIALAFAAECQTRTLILVHTKDILDQWVTYIENSIPEMKGEVGIIRGQTTKVGQITVAMVRTLYNRLDTEKKSWWDQFGCVIADEAHHVSAPTWEAVLNQIPAKYRFGFTASPTRADGMHPTMRFIIGPIIHRQKFSSPVKLQVVPVKTEFRTFYRGPFDWTPLLTRLVEDEGRNKQIAEVAMREVEEGNSVLVLSRRIAHLENVAEEMNGDCEILTGKRSNKDRKRILEDFRAGKIKCLLATQLADEALDVQRLNRVLLIHPGKHEGRLIQQLGRAIRMHPDKDDAKIYDFIDHRMGVLRRQWALRKRTYKANRISIKSSRRLSWR